MASASPSVVVLYFSPRCPNSVRFIQSMKKTRLARCVSAVNVDQTPVQGLKFLPTLVVDGRHHVGSEAFSYLKQFDGDVSLDAYEGASARGSCSLPFSSVSDSSGFASYIENFSSLGPPE
jgi:hypothetical protein